MEKVRNLPEDGAAKQARRTRTIIAKKFPEEVFGFHIISTVVPIINKSTDHILGYLYIFTVTSGYKEIMLNSLIPIAMYFIFQTIFYNITKDKYIKEVIL